jgi:hypothetical protein
MAGKTGRGIIGGKVGGVAANFWKEGESRCLKLGHCGVGREKRAAVLLGPHLEQQKKRKVGIHA